MQRRRGSDMLPGRHAYLRSWLQFSAISESKSPRDAASGFLRRQPDQSAARHSSLGACDRIPAVDVLGDSRLSIQAQVKKVSRDFLQDR